MARPASDLLTERETQLMEALWAGGPATAEAVRAALADELHDSTVRTLLRVLKQKGYVRVRGRQPATYEAIVPRDKVQGRAAQSLLKRFFGGSAEALVMRLVEDEELSPELLDRQRKNLNRGKRKGGKSS
jgi:BlaI family penicillinase repressor